MSIPERILLHVDHPRFQNISGEVYEIDTKRGPMRNVRFKRSYLNNGTLGASSSVALSEVDAVIELARAIKAHFLPESPKCSSAESIPSPSVQRPEHVVYTANKHTPELSDSASAQKYGSDSKYDEQLSSGGTQFDVDDDDLPF
jgi:hypothetical protein